MRTVFVLFDSLNRFPLMETSGIPTPNFDRLAKRSVEFTNHYVGSMPCMPARRDLHTGRLSFLHRGWGPLEPFDNSLPVILREGGVRSHLATDHYHYFEDGGATYHTRYSTYEFFRGQERDPWIGLPPLGKDALAQTHHRLHLDRFESNPAALPYVENRKVISQEENMPSTKCFEAGVAFLKANHGADDWFLQIETFDPHEPFIAPEQYKKLFKTGYEGPILEWPNYKKVAENKEEIAELRANYAALVCHCDARLGRVLDVFDDLGLWEDTALAVTTDHGFLLGEHDWWGKNQMPIYNEIAHIPLYFHHPGLSDRAGTTCDAVTQNIDLMPTFLELHGVDVPADVQGIPLTRMLEDGARRKLALYGFFGSGINATDGNHTYFWYPEHDRDAELYQYTLMPTNMVSFFDAEDLLAAELVEGSGFTNGMPVLRVPLKNKLAIPHISANIDNPSELYDLSEDPEQLRPCDDPETEAAMRTAILEMITEMDAPPELLKRFTTA